MAGFLNKILPQESGASLPAWFQAWHLSAMSNINSYVFCYYCFWYLYKWCMCHRTNIILMMKRKKDPYRRDFFFFKELSEESFFLIQGSWNEIPFLSVTGILYFEVLWEKVLFWEDLWDSVFQYFPICWPKY